jgi:hypothetical protein
MYRFLFLFFFYFYFSVPLLEVKIEKESRAVSANKPQQVTCRAVGSSPPPHISWWKAGSRLQANHETVNFKVWTVTLIS